MVATGFLGDAISGIVVGTASGIDWSATLASLVRVVAVVFVIAFDASTDRRHRGTSRCDIRRADIEYSMLEKRLVVIDGSGICGNVNRFLFVARTENGRFGVAR